MVVPKNKKVYIGKRKFVEGDFLPQYVQRYDINFKEEKPKVLKSKPVYSGSYNKKSNSEN